MQLVLVLFLAWRRTSCALNDPSRLCEDCLASLEFLNFVPDLVTRVVRVDRRNAGLGVGEGLGQPFDTIPVGLYACCHDQRVIGNVTSCRSGDRRFFWRERLDALGDVIDELRNDIAQGFASVFLLNKSRANKSPSEKFSINSMSYV